MGTSFSITQLTTIIIMRAFVAIPTLFSCAAAQYAYAGLPYAAAPAAAPYAAPHAAPYAPYVPSSQFQAQDEFGNLNYGYANLNSAKQETGNTYAGVTGGYSYVDANGQLQKVEYIADGAGFRVADSRLPVFNPDLPVAPVYTGVAPTFNPEPLVAPVYTGVAPASVVDTPEVAEAKAAHAAALVAAAAAAADRKKREADPAILGGATTVLSVPTPLIHNAPVLHHLPIPVLAMLDLDMLVLDMLDLDMLVLDMLVLDMLDLDMPVLDMLVSHTTVKLKRF